MIQNKRTFQDYLNYLGRVWFSECLVTRIHILHYLSSQRVSGKYMRDPKRIDKILGLIKQIWLNHPDLRFQQLIYILQSDYSHKNNSIGKVESIEKDGYSRIGFDLFNTEDDQFIEFLSEKVKTTT
jgi:hypothetical protein